MGLPNTAIVVHAVGQELLQRGRLDDALTYYRGRLAGLPVEHPLRPSVLTAIGQLLRRKGDHAAAIEHLQRALEAKREAISASHPFIAFTLMELGEAYLAADLQVEALDTFTRALPVLERRLGALHPQTIAAHLALARLLASAGQIAEARVHADKVLETEIYGLGNAIQIGMANALAAHLAYQEGDLDGAISRFQAALTELEPLGDADPEVLGVLHDLGRALHRRGDGPAARRAFERCLEGYRASVGSEHPATAMILNAIGQVLYSEGRYQEALERYHQALAIRQRVLGVDNPQTITTRFNCGTAMRQLGDPFGLEEMHAAVETLEELLGPDHPQVQATRAWLR